VLLRPTAAHATTGAFSFGADNDAGSDDTSLTSTNPNFTLAVLNTSNGEALKVHTTSATDVNLALHAIDEGLGGGIFAESTNTDISDLDNLPLPAIIGEGVMGGVVGYTDSALGAGVAGFAAAGTGPGVGAAQLNTTATSDAFEAVQTGKGRAVYAHIENEDAKSTVVSASTTGSGVAIAANSAKGAAGKFTGHSAQIVLVPSSLASHPASGTAGALFVDKSKRLWFCKGGTTWRQLA
jgi:hypothetical protein